MALSVHGLTRNGTGVSCQELRVDSDVVLSDQEHGAQSTECRALPIILGLI
jgi:hypothetical protein